MLLARGMEIFMLKKLGHALHSIVHRGESSNKALAKAGSGLFVDTVPQPDGTFKSSLEFVAARLVRIASKAFAVGGGEKSGCHRTFAVYFKPFLRQNELSSLSLKLFNQS